MTPLATYFSKPKLMTRFQSHQCIGFHKKEDIIGDLKVPEEKYVAKGVIGDLSAVELYTSGAN